MILLFVDPGPTELGWCRFNTDTELPIDFGIEDTKQFQNRVHKIDADLLIEERIMSYGSTANQTLYDTWWEAAIIADRWERRAKKPYELLSRKDIKMAICGACAGVNDTAVKDEIKYRYKLLHKLCKKWPAPFTGLNSHAFAAFAGALAWWELRKAKQWRKTKRKQKR